MVYSRFENLAEEKKKKIIDACIEEFSQNGYLNASTNNIVKNAEISKGILFHYFGSKKKLYFYILDYVTDFISGIIYKKMDGLPGDFFKKITEVGLIKLKVAYEYPVMYKFVIDAYTHAPEPLKYEMQEKYEKYYRDNIPAFFKDIDTSKFRKDIDKNKAIEFIVLSLEAISNKYFNACRNKPIDDIIGELENITKEYMDYIEILKYGVYNQMQ